MGRTFEWPNDGKDHYHTSPNPEDESEDCGLTLLARFDEDDLSYEFNTFLLLQDNETGNVYGVSDSGCSCPTPFEDVHGLDDMAYLPSVTAAKALFDQWNKDYEGRPLVESVAAHREIEGCFK